MRLLYIFILIFGFLNAAQMSPVQKDNLDRCFTIAEILKNQPYDVCAILLNETSAKTHYVGDKFLKKFQRSYGLMQVRLNTAKMMINYYDLKDFKKFSDEIILSKLIFDKNFNILMGNLYYKYLLNKYHDTKKAVIAYNSGHYDPDNLKYYLKFLKNKKWLLENYIP